MSNFFQVTETFENLGSKYVAKLFVDNDSREAFFSFSINGRLFAVNYPVRYGAVYDQRRARNALKARETGWSFMSRAARAALLERPFDMVSALEDFRLAA